MKTVYDLASLDWRLSGWIPYLWSLERSMEVGASPKAEVPAIPACVPGSVQRALREHGLLPDWNVGLNARQCEWVENRHWIFETEVPQDWLRAGKTVRLRCEGLDYCGWVFLNASEAGSFRGSFVPHVFDLTSLVADGRNVLRIVFDHPPRWLGQFGYTSRMTEWKTRFNYTWDWTVRLVQTGVTGAVTLEAVDGAELQGVRCWTETGCDSETGVVRIRGTAAGADGLTVRAALTLDGAVCARSECAAGELASGGADIGPVPVRLWWPNGMGERPLYTLDVSLTGPDGVVHDSFLCRVGFRDVRWEPCPGAPPEADPWVCVVNGTPVFLQGVNWTPLSPLYADVSLEDYRHLVSLYAEMGCNILRVWGGAALEREEFYDLCDEAGLMVWQEFPLSSSGRENLPPSDEASVRAHEQIARSYIERRQHHPSLILWCGGNELQTETAPCDISHPLLRRQGEVVAEMDPGRRFLPTSASGPRFYADPARFGEGVHWDVHGPWKTDGSVEDWLAYWEADDALMRSEVGAPGASPAGIIRRYAGDCPVMPATPANPLWRRTSVWWIEWDRFVAEHGREPESVEEYVEWSQQRQAELLRIAAECCRRRFPRCGGFIVWMGHDCFPCTSNTAIIDFHGRPKPAARALAEVFLRPGAPEEGS